MSLHGEKEMFWKSTSRDNATTHLLTVSEKAPIGVDYLFLP